MFNIKQKKEKKTKIRNLYKYKVRKIEKMLCDQMSSSN